MFKIGTDVAPVTARMVAPTFDYFCDAIVHTFPGYVGRWLLVQRSPQLGSMLGGLCEVSGASAAFTYLRITPPRPAKKMHSGVLGWPFGF